MRPVANRSNSPWTLPVRVVALAAALAAGSSLSASPQQPRKKPPPLTAECLDLQERHRTKVGEKRILLRQGGQKDKVTAIDAELLKLAVDMQRMGNCPIPRS